MLTSTIIALSTAFFGADSIDWVKDKQPKAIIVVPADAHPIATHAAQELAYHVQKATGVTLKIEQEPNEPTDQTKIYVGSTNAARVAGIDIDSLSNEAVALRTIGPNTYIAGKDGPGDALSTKNVNSGTLWGVYEILERHLGVRWLWPGTLGEYVPEKSDITIPKLDEIVRPSFNQRLLRAGLGLRGFTQGNERLGFTPENRERYANDQNLFLRRHRMGESESSFYAQPSAGHGHSFEGWWEKYSKEHPDWFQLNPDGTRGPSNPEKPKKVTMCVSNPGLQDEIVRLWQEEREKKPGKRVNIGIGENDDSAMCTCEACKAWDGPQPDVSALPPGLERSFLPMQASDRYTRFMLAVQERANRIDPDVRVHRYAYLNYFWAPAPDIKLNKNIVIGFVPWLRAAGWYPRAQAEHDWIKQQWIGWQKSGATLYWRPNWFLDGYTMPLVYVHQFADEFQFYAQHEMTGTDFDSLQGQWSTQGPNLYLLARIHTRPQIEVEALLDEYYNAFGPAAPEVKDYFNYWEDYSIKKSPRAVESIRKRRDGAFRRYALYAQVADELYPQDVFGPAFSILGSAKTKVESASAEQTYRDRIKFLEDGLRHAQQCAATAAVVNNPSTTLDERRAAIAKLLEVRQTLQHTNASNLDRAAIIETDSWKEITGLFD
jgi:hypothetical protein